MGYTIGVSSGVWSIPPSPDEKQQYLTVMRKVFWGAQKGVEFTQVDIETINEFQEPWIKEQIERIRSLGLRFGLHGETSAYTGTHTLPLESAQRNEYIIGHDRLIAHMNGAGKIKAEYVNIHASELLPLIQLYRDLQVFDLVDFWGRPLSQFLKENPSVVDWALNSKEEKGNAEKSSKLITGILERFSRRDHETHFFNQFRQKHGKDPDAKQQEGIKKDAERERREDFINSPNQPTNFTYGAEKAAYWMIAKYMELTNDQLWIDIVGKGKSIDDMMERWEKWVPAVAAKYVWGHFNPEKCPDRGHTEKFPDPKILLEKYKLKWTFETEMAKFGYEKHMRLSRIPHIYYLVKSIGSDWIGVCMDVEHLLSAGHDPFKEIADLPPGGGKRILVMHLGWPTPHIPSHAPVPIGSEAQEYIYKVLYELRKKGMEGAYLIFERGGGDDPVKTTVQSFREIVKYLEKDTNPKDLPPEFFGIKPGRLARERVFLREHFLDPLKGLMNVPEEEYGVFSTSAVQKGKAEEWKKRQFR